MERTLQLGSDVHRRLVFGPRDRHLRMIRDGFGVHLTARDETIRIAGDTDAVESARTVLEELLRMADDGQIITESEVQQIIDTVGRSGRGPALKQIEVFTAGRPVRPQTPGQLAYCEAIDRNDLVFCIGPAGTGKTYLAVAMAVQMLKHEQIKRIALVRPAVEAGEKLGFLPGDLEAKVNPYLRPLLDALHDMMGFKQVRAYMETDVIEIIPLAYMRGRTLNDAAIILDEAQNSTSVQMKMFLTRMGMRSKMIVTGDITQVDLEAGQESGLVDAINKLSDLERIAIVELAREDIIRHRLVQAIVDAYEQGDRGREDRSDRRRRRRNRPAAEPESEPEPDTQD